MQEQYPYQYGSCLNICLPKPLLRKRNRLSILSYCIRKRNESEAVEQGTSSNRVMDKEKGLLDLQAFKTKTQLKRSTETRLALGLTAVLGNVKEFKYDHFERRAQSLAKLGIRRLRALSAV